jgi:hypothetical protein
MNCCEEVSFFKSIASIGNSTLDSHRSKVLIFNSLLSLLSGLLMCVAMAGGSTDDTNVQNGAWYYAENGSSINAYVGLKRLSNKSGGGTNWSSCTASYCNDCNNSGATALNCSVLVFLVTIAILVSSVLRINSDKVLYKSTIVIGGSLNIFMMIIGMGAFHQQCLTNLPTSGNISYAAAPGLNSILTTFFFTIFIVLCNLFTSVSGAGSGAEAPLTTTSHNVV